VIKQERSNDLDFQIIDERPETPGYKEKKLDQQRKSIEYILKMANIDLGSYTLLVKFRGNLLAASGVGASAASCAAFARAINQEYDLGLDDNAINDLAFEGEKAYHGSPSGVDNTAATYGGLIQFTKGETSKFEHIKTPVPVEIVLGNTGLVTNTEKAVDGVRERKEKDPEKYGIIFEHAQKLIPLARASLENGDYHTVGRLMKENHELLQEIEVSCEELDQLVNIAQDNGAWGAKMTGSGLGGYMIALTPNSELQETVAKAIKNEGFEVVKTTIGV
jgi:mevalonate kinase